MSKDHHRLTEAMVRAAIATAASRSESEVEVIDFSGDDGVSKGEGFTTTMRAITARAKEAEAPRP